MAYKSSNAEMALAITRKYAEKAVPARQIITPPRGTDGLFIQTKEVGPEREIKENHHREGFANHFKFADPFTGNTKTFDKTGRYNCGACNQADGNKCLLVAMKRIDREAGSCGDWEMLCAGDPEMNLMEKSIASAGYGIAANGMGFGCHRCPYASPAHEPDSRGRELYCGKGDFRTFGNACCGINGAKVVGGGPKEDYSNLSVPPLSAAADED